MKDNRTFEEIAATYHPRVVDALVERYRSNYEFKRPGQRIITGPGGEPCWVPDDA